MSVKTTLLLSLLVASAVVATATTFSEDEVEILFTEWAAKHGKTYAHEGVRQFRKAVFTENLRFIEEHNALHAAGLKTFTVALNQFGDLSNAEYRDTVLALPINLREVEMMNVNAELHIDGQQVLADSVDWRSKGVVSKVKNQGQCGSCWSFSATGAIEGAWKLAGNSLQTFSEQQLVDCSSRNQGCNGGLPSWAFEYVMEKKGIESESAYPYTARQGSCRFSSGEIAGHISGYRNVSSGSESSLVDAINTAPVSVAIDASHSSFQFYSKGVYNEPACSSTRLDHGVLAVGYGTDSGSSMYIVKNSWGPSWGQQGYIYMTKGSNNQCGIATLASYPHV